MKKLAKPLTLLLSGVMTVATLASCFTFTTDTSSSSSSSSSSSYSGTFTQQSLYEYAQSLGYDGSFEEFRQFIKGDKGDKGDSGDDGVGIDDIYVSNGHLYVRLSNSSQTIDLGEVKGKDGQSGKNGATWLSGEGAPGAIVGVKEGDFYFDKSSGTVYQYKSNAWVFSTQLKADRTYVGYDGYIWEGATRTEQKVQLDRPQNVVEDTLSLKDNEYFTETTVPTKTKTVSVMSGYMPYSKNTFYSKGKITEITFYATEAGKLEIGAINLKTGAKNMSIYTVNKGKNTVFINQKFAENETLAFGGGNTTVNILASCGVDGGDTCGEYSLNTSTFETEKSLSIANKLMISAVFKGEQVVSTVFSNVKNEAVNNTWTKVLANGGDPYVYYNLDLFSGKTLSKIGMFVESVSALDGNQTFTVYKLKKSSVRLGCAAAITEEYTIKPRASTWTVDNTASTTTIQKWVDFDVSDYAINVAEDETLAFGSSTDTIKYDFFYGGATPAEYAFYVGVKTGAAVTYSTGQNLSGGLAFSFEFKPTEETFEQHKQTLSKLETKAYLAGKKLSVLGDSISTLKDWSNNTSHNSSLANNAIYYNPDNDIARWLPTNGTWWQNAAAQMGMEVLVDNAWAGSWVWNKETTIGSWGGDSLASSVARACNLHSNEGVNPDVIGVYMGTNDFLSGAAWGVDCGDPLSASRVQQLIAGTVQPQSFADGYALMLHRILSKYTSAEVFCFTILPCIGGSDTAVKTERLAQYNEVIRSAAAYFNLPLVDLNKRLLINGDNYDAYYVDRIHPNPLGMSMIANEFVEVIYEHFAK